MTATAVGAFTVSLALTACSPTPTPDDQARSASPTSTAAEGRPSMNQYRDGTYEARGWYGGLPSHHDVTLTIENNTVTAVEITTPAEDETSLGYQQRFAAALPRAIVGRPIDELDIDRLAGSSGCSEGFMNALEQIRTDAQP